MKTCPTCQHTYTDDFSHCPLDGAPLIAQATETEAQIASGPSRRFRLVRRLGKGGMGTVFLAEQMGVGNRPVALKILNSKLLDDPDFLLRFQNEAGSTGRIHHPNVVTIYESAQADDGTPYIAMEFLEGESLRDVLKQKGALPLPEVVGILQQTAKGLNAAHKLGIIHRNLKPDNIFLMHGDEGELVVKVVDFGIAKLRESPMHTQTGTVLGTPAYMSFEQASGMRSDELDGTPTVSVDSVLQLSALILSNGHPNTSVTWSVNGVKGGNSSVSTITANGPSAASFAAPNSVPILSDAELSEFRTFWLWEPLKERSDYIRDWVEHKRESMHRF